MEPREVPLGGPRAMHVRRTLPQRHRSLIGAWCFLDHYGPDEVADSGGMSVAPHPHTGLQTVSWLFTGEVEHRDSAGNHAMVRPGELNLMTAGRGISHSEVSPSSTPRCTGPSSGWHCRSRRDTPTPASTTTRRRPCPATAGWRGCSSGRCWAAPRRCRRTRRCSGPSCCSSRGPTSRSTSIRRTSTASSSTAVWPRSSATRSSRTSSATSRPGRPPVDHLPRRAGAGARARRRAVRGVDRDVVECFLCIANPGCSWFC